MPGLADMHVHLIRSALKHDSEPVPASDQSQQPSRGLDFSGP
jgi:predicted amidohydrolase YtcJ